MARTDFTKPIHVTTWMGVFLALIVTLAALFLPQIEFAFLANPVFNGVILLVFAIGVAINFGHIWTLQREVLWVESFRAAGPEAPHATKPVLLSSLAKQFATASPGGPLLSPTARRSILDGVQIRLEEQRDRSRYLIGALIFIGLLGTFWGLLITVRSVGDIIGGITAGASAIETFETLKSQLEGPLGGMATSFACSLFGLAGSLVIGFLDLNAGHAQGRFYHELDQWLTAMADGQDIAPDDADVRSVIARTAESLGRVERSLSERVEPGISSETGEEIRDLLRQLAERPNDNAQLSDDVRAELRLMTRAISTALGNGKPE